MAEDGECGRRRTAQQRRPRGRDDLRLRGRADRLARGRLRGERVRTSDRVSQPALGRRSALPLIRISSVAFIEIWRGVPLITVLFLASYMLPLFVPTGFTMDGLMRVLIGISLFAGAYLAEVIRGGLQAIPRGQAEAAHALGLSWWKTNALVVLPQALRHVIPGIVNSFIGMFKDTSLVSIVALFDLLGSLRASFSDPLWATPSTVFTGFAFTGLIYFGFCFGMSRYSLFTETRLNAHRRT